MKSILFIIHSLPGGGAEKALIELLKVFDYSSYRVSLCLLYYEGIYLKEIPSEVEVIVLYEKKNSFYRKSFRYYKSYGLTCLLAFQIRRKTRKHYDTIISFTEDYPLFFHRFIVSRANKNISWVHCDLLNFHYSLNTFRGKEEEMECYKKMDDIVFVSREAMSNFDKLFSVSANKRCLYNVVNVEEIRQLSQQYDVASDKLTITAIGRLIDVKNFSALIRIAKMFKDIGYSLSFWIIGVGEEQEMLLKLRDELGLQNDVSFLGFVKTPFGYLNKSDILVSTSLTEGLPLVICEAFALGVPVVATKTAGAMELLEGGRYGILTDFDDNSIFEGIRQLIDNKEIMEKYRQSARERALSFDVDLTMEKVYDIL